MEACQAIGALRCRAQQPVRCDLLSWPNGKWPQRTCPNRGSPHRRSPIEMKACQAIGLFKCRDSTIGAAPSSVMGRGTNRHGSGGCRRRNRLRRHPFRLNSRQSAQTRCPSIRASRSPRRNPRLELNRPDLQCPMSHPFGPRMSVSQVRPPRRELHKVERGHGIDFRSRSADQAAVNRPVEKGNGTA